MAAKMNVLPSARALFPKSANAAVVVRGAWHPDRSTLPRPAPGGMDGWADGFVPAVATRELIKRLRGQGYTWVNLECAGCANPRDDVEISRLL